MQLGIGPVLVLEVVLHHRERLGRLLLRGADHTPAFGDIEPEKPKRQPRHAERFARTCGHANDAPGERVHEGEEHALMRRNRDARLCLFLTQSEFEEGGGVAPCPLCSRKDGP
jgi:hypothetical protein